MVTKNLDISTAHITKLDASMLDVAATRHDLSPVVVYKYDEGYFVYVPDNTDDFEDRAQAVAGAGFSKGFLAVFNKAHAEGCKYAQLDSDGETYPDLPTHEW